MGLFGKKETKSPRVGEIDGDGSYAQEIVGESNYRNKLYTIIKAHGALDEGELELSASIIPDPENEFDSNAIAVFIEGSKVGYIARSETYKFHQLFKEHNLDGMNLKARLGWDTDNPEPMIGVRLDIDLD